MNIMQAKSPQRILFFLGLFITSLLFMSVHGTEKVSASYDGARIIDNAVFLDANAMSMQEVQNFLVARGSGLASRSFALNCYGPTSKERQWYTAVGAPCDQIIPASNIIFYASQIYGVNPKVVLATLQKEQSLITSPNPTDWQINQAMGYACPTSGGCGSSTFPYQIDSGVWVLRYHYERANGNTTWWNNGNYTCGNKSSDIYYSYYKPGLVPGQSVTFYDGLGYYTRNASGNYVPGNGVPYRTYTIANAATAAFYCYTPHAYNNPQGQYGRAPFGTTGQYYSGSYNFVLFYELWFGSTYAFIHNGVSYRDVFDPEYYLNQYPDLQTAFGNNHIAAFNHFIYYGMNEKRQAIANFNVTPYRNLYVDLRVAYENNLPAYFLHYIQHGKAEGRVATGNIPIQYVTSYGGVNYSDVYDFQSYKTNNPDVQYVFNDNDTGAIRHFVTSGMTEKRVAKDNFNVTNYKNSYPDIRYIYGNNMPAYYMHYIQHGKAEGRITTSSTLNYYSALGGVEYMDVYNFTTYKDNYSDIRTILGNDELATLKHFIQNGMNESRQASSNFNVIIYKQRYADLQQAFGNNMPAYYMHYIQHGKAEGRIAI